MFVGNVKVKIKKLGEYFYVIFNPSQLMGLSAQSQENITSESQLVRIPLRQNGSDQKWQTACFHVFHCEIYDRMWNLIQCRIRVYSVESKFGSVYFALRTVLSVFNEFIIEQRTH